MDQPSPSCLLSRLTFHRLDQDLPERQTTSRTIAYPNPVRIAVSRLPVDGLSLPPQDTGVMPADGLDILTLLPGSETPIALQQLSSDWMSAPAGSSDFENFAIDLPLRNGQIRWRGARVVVQVPFDHVDDLIAAIGAFAWLWLDVERVQQRLESDWPAQSHDAGAMARFSFSYSTGRRLSEKAVEAIRDRQWFLRATLALERGDKGLSRHTLRIFFELCHQLELTKRLVLIGEMIESRAEIYEQASGRVFEFRLFLISSFLEAAILVGIMSEIVLLLVYNL